MPDRAALARVGKRLAAEIAAGQPGPGMDAAARLLEAWPDAALELIETLLAEAEKKRPNEDLVVAYGFMLGQALEFARLAAEGGFAPEADLIDAVRQLLLAATADERIEPTLLLLILRAFASAKLDPGPELRAVMGRLSERAALDAPAAESDPEPLAALARHLEELAREVGGDPFELYVHVQEMASAFPEEQRVMFGGLLLRSGEGPAREAGLGWVLDGSAAVRNAAAAELGAAAARGGVSGTMLRRLITVRNWVPEADRAAVDHTIATSRRNGVEVTPWPKAQVTRVLASAIDGAGAQSVFVVVREGRRNAIGCLLLKHGVGIRDAWARHALTRGELGAFLEQLEQLDLVPTNLDYVRIAAAHALAGNLESGEMPPFTLVDALETAGLEGVQPEALTAGAVLNLLETDADPALSKPAAVEKLLASSARLPGRIGVLESWFEADTEVERLLGEKGMTRVKRIARVRDEVLPKLVPKWVERLAWTALTLRHAEQNAPWEAFYCSARELEAGRPVAGIPLMMHVAAQTVDAYTATRR